MLRLAEEIILLMIDENTNRLHQIPENRLNLVLAGATLMDLALENRIDTDLERLMLVDTTSMEDSLLDPVLSQIAADSTGRDTSFWLQHIAAQGEEIRDRALARLVERDILNLVGDDFIFLATGVSRTRYYPSEDGQAEEDIRLRIMRVLFANEIPDPRDIAIISLLDACDQFDKIMDLSASE